MLQINTSHNLADLISDEFIRNSTGIIQVSKQFRKGDHK